MYSDACISGPLKCRMGPQSRKDNSAKLLSYVRHIPYEFARKPRAITEFERWKATEFRTFLLYTGPVCLVDEAPEIYSNFMLLSAAMACLLNPTLCYNYAEYSRQLLVMFVKKFGELYGKDRISYNVHGLIHLADDAMKYGALDTVSCFLFENHLGLMKRMIRKSSTPLQQIIHRLHENQLVPLMH